MTNYHLVMVKCKNCLEGVLSNAIMLIHGKFEAALC